MGVLEDKSLLTETVLIDYEAYRFHITGTCITRYSRKGTETSKGLIVPTHFEPAYGCLFLAHLLKDCEVKEAIEHYFMGDEKDISPKSSAV